MPADRSFAGGGARKIQTNNKIDLRDGDRALVLYDATLADVWFYYVDGANKYVRDKANAVGQRVKLTWTLDGSAIALKDDVPVKFGERSLYTARCKGITGLPAADADLERAVGTKCEVNVETVMRTPKDGGAPPYWWAEVKDAQTRERVKARPPVMTQPPGEISPDHEIGRHDLQRRAAAAAEPAHPPFTVDYLLSELPLPVAQSVRKLGEWAGLDERKLAVKIGCFSGRNPLALGDVEALKTKIKTERAA